jgi:CMP-2-keto-3-deoxyoctulosonic acid synthetase
MKYIITEKQHHQISDRIIDIAMDKLYDDLKVVKIIPYRGDVWFIDPNTKEWYFKYGRDDNGKNGVLTYRVNFFETFFNMFSMMLSDFEPLLIDLVFNVVEEPIMDVQISRSNKSQEVNDVLDSIKK